MTMNIKVLVVSPEYPYPPTDGHKLRIYNILKNVITNFEFDFLAFGETDMGNASTLRSQLGPTCGQVELIPRSSLVPIKSRSWLGSFWNIYYPDKMSMGEPYYSPAMISRINACLASNRYNLVFVCGLYINFHFDINSIPAPYIVDVVDSPSLYFWSNFKQEYHPFRKLMKYLNYIWADRYEKLYVSQIKNIIMISTVDAEIIARNCPNSRIWVVPNGVDTEYFKPSSPLPTVTSDLLFTGVMNYPPNNTAMLYFIKEVLPLVRLEIPEVTLTIAGKNPTPELKSLVDQTPGARVTGFVEDIRPYFEASTVYVSPLLTGAGLKNKVLEAWSMTMPIVATTASCSGIAARNNENLLIADTPAEFAAKILALLADGSLRDRLSLHGRETAKSDYSWTNCGKKLCSVFDEIITLEGSRN